MSIALVASTTMIPSGTSGGTSGPVDTRGADLIVFVEPHSFSGPVVSVGDNLGNTYSVHAFATDSSFFTVLVVHHCLAPVTSASHTFYATSGAPGAGTALSILAFSGVNTVGPTTPVGAFTSGASGSTMQAGPITVVQDGSVIISVAHAIGFGSPDAPGTFSVDSGFTLAEQMPFDSPNHYGQVAAYLVQGVAANIQPTFTYGNTTQGWAAGSIAYPPAPDNVLTCAAGTFTETGRAATFLCGRAIRAETGVFTLRGFPVPAGSSAGYFRLVAAYGAFTLTGEAATLAKIKLMVLDTGYFILTGEDADFLQVTPWEAAHICGDTPDPWTPQ